MLVAFDFDGTLSDSEMTVLLGRRKGVAGEMETITEQAMNDEIDYAGSLRGRARLLKGLPEAEAWGAFDEVRLRPGTGDLIDALRAAGHHVAILTGGFDRGVEAALDAAETEVDTIVANRLSMSGGQLTGEVRGPLIEGTKDEALADLADRLDLPMDHTVAVGDGANDLPMLKLAALAIGYEPKAAVEPHCDDVVSSMAELRELFVEHGLL